MPIKITCPKCGKTGRVADERAGGKVKCPSCSALISVPAGATPLPTAMPPMPTPDEEIDDYLDDEGDDRSVAAARIRTKAMAAMDSSDDVGDYHFPEEHKRRRKFRAKAAKGLVAIVDTAVGSERDDVFLLAQGEKRVDELTIHHMTLGIIKSGMTRVTLTNDRLLYTTTLVFSLVHWILLFLFSPLFFFYLARLAKNRSITLPLESIDSVEKRYRIVWLYCVLGIFIGWFIIVFLNAQINDGWFKIIVLVVIASSLPAALLLVLLLTRLPKIVVHTHSNHFSISYSVVDKGIDEQRLDAFLQSVCAQLERKRSARSPGIPESAAL